MAESPRKSAPSHRWAIASATAFLMAITAVVAVAVRSDGYRSYEAELNDGGIWVTNGEIGAFGRINKPIGQLDGALFADQETALDVVQDGPTVIGIDQSATTIAPIDPSTVANPPGVSARIPAGAQVQLAGATLAVLDPEDGRLWAQRTGTFGGEVPVSALDSEADPVATVGPSATMAVAVTGEIFTVASGEAELRRFVVRDEVFGTSVPQALPEAPSAPALTAVGATPVVLDEDTGTLQWGEDLTVDVPTGSVLQRPGPSAAEVLVATSDRLLAVDLATGEIRVVVEQSGGGEPTPPVRLGACSYAAWSGASASVSTACGSAEATVAPLGSPANDLVFRVNRDEIILNDRATGAVWSLDESVPTQLDDWESFQSEDVVIEDDDKQEAPDARGDGRPPNAEPDEFGARIGRSTVLHPLDNDTAPVGSLLAITGVADLRGSDAGLEISPDGQTVQIRLPAGAKTTTFTYTIDDGSDNGSAEATVTVTPRPDEQNESPRLRVGFEPTTWKVPEGGQLDLPVLADWRDAADGDLLSIESASIDTDEGSVSVTDGGRVRITAPDRAGPATVTYAVGDGFGNPTLAMVDIDVQSLEDRSTTAPTAEPDVVAGEVGRPLVIRPLANDRPGSDPVEPDATLELAGRVADSAGAQVTTDLVGGSLVVRAQEAGTFFLDYDVKYGNARFDRGLIRVDIRATPESAPPPVAVPDTASLFGQSPTLVDVLVNDVDPSGGILVVEAGEADDPQQIEVGVVQGRWLRLSAPTGALDPNPQVVRYTISNGVTGSVPGEVLVTSRPVPDDDSATTPVTDVDRVSVREGASVSVPVLDNDFSPLGDELGLVATLDGQSAGQLDVRSAGDDPGPLGEAFVAGRFVRYVAPVGLEDSETFTIRYVATDSRGRSAPGRVEVTVIPAQRPNRDPEPPGVEGRAIAGQPLKLRLPGVGVDPDGDSVTLTEISTPPSLGRIVSYGATSLEYQPFPTSQGTDEFEYTVTDSRGASASGAVRVAVIAPDASAAPLAVDDSATLEPGRLARIEVLGNDLVPDGDTVELRLVNPPAGARLVTPTGPLEVRAPEEVGGRNVEIVYEVDNGVATSRATVTVRAATPYNLPPVVFDSFAQDAPGEVAEVDVLESAFDPDGGSDAALRVTEVFPPPGVDATVVGDSLRVDRGAVPAVVPFRVEDADGGAATANLYVPAALVATPRLIEGAAIEVDAGSGESFRLADYVEDPSGGPVRLTLKNRISSSPSGALTAQVVDDDTFRIDAERGQSGPAAVTMEVTTGSSVDDGDGAVAQISVPVQIGDTTPILTCGRTPIEITQGRQVDLNIASLCNPYTPDPRDEAGLVYDATWGSAPSGLTLVEPRGSRITISADATARPGQQGSVRVTASGSDPGEIRVVVVAAPPPRLSPIRVDDLAPGESRVIDVATYLRSSLPAPEATVVSVKQVRGPAASGQPRGSQAVIRAGSKGGGEVEFRIVVSDVRPAGGPSRQTTGRILARVLGRPEAPAAPVPGATQRDGEVVLSWRAPDDNGSPITGYDVRGGGVSKTCGSTTCEIGGLTNGKSYRFQVRARNAVGVSAFSAPSKAAVPDRLPGQVGPISLVEAGDRQLSIKWSAPKTQTSKVTYQVVWPGGRQDTAATKTVVPGLDNNRQYKITVRAINDRGPGPIRTSGAFQSIGTPGTPRLPSLTDQKTAGDAGAVTLTWAEVDPNGPDPVRYTVLRNGSPLPRCTNITKRTCDNSGITYDGSTYRYRVRATNANGKGLTSAAGPAAAYTAVGTPAEFGPVSVTPTGKASRALVEFNAPDPRGAKTFGQIIVDGTVVSKTFSRVGPSRYFPLTGTNSRPQSVVVKVCNEAQRCSESRPVEVQTYGPIARRHILRIAAQVNGPRVRWKVTLDPNGNDAEVKIEVKNKRNCQVNNCGDFTFVELASFQNVPGPGERTVTTNWYNIGYESDSKAEVRFRDRNPNRGDVSASNSVKTGKKPKNRSLSANRTCPTDAVCRVTGPQPPA